MNALSRAGDGLYGAARPGYLETPMSKATKRDSRANRRKAKLKASNRRRRARADNGR